MNSNGNPINPERPSRGVGFGHLTWYRWLWPDLDDESNARKAMKHAAGACLFVAGASLFVGLLSYLGARIGRFDAWAMLDGVLFAIIAWRIYRMSRAWAIVGLALYLLEIYDKLAYGQPVGAWFVTVIILLYIIGGVRGAFALQRLRRESGNQEAGSRE